MISHKTLHNLECKFAQNKTNNVLSNVISANPLSKLNNTTKDQTMNLGLYNALPYTAKPVLDFDNRNKAWYLTTESIRIAIEHDNESSFRLDSSKEIQKLRERLIAGYLDKNSK